MKIGVEKLSAIERLHAKKILRKYAESNLSALPPKDIDWVVRKQDDTDLTKTSNKKGMAYNVRIRKIEKVYEIHIKTSGQKICTVRYSAKENSADPKQNKTEWSVKPNRHEDYYLLAFFLKIGKELNTIRALMKKLESKTDMTMKESTDDVTESLLKKIIPLIRKVYSKPEFREYRQYMDTTIDMSVPCIYFCTLQEGIDDNNPGANHQWFYHLRHALVIEVIKYLKFEFEKYGFKIDVGDDDSALYLVDKDTPQWKMILGSKFYQRQLM